MKILHEYFMPENIAEVNMLCSVIAALQFETSEGDRETMHACQKRIKEIIVKPEKTATS